VTELVRRGWRWLREVSGDDAYERYLAHWHALHRADAAEPLVDRAAFFKMEQRRKWEGVRRCC
jgi:uncharacterized short protein YbdD (DUF466 family)